MAKVGDDIRARTRGTWASNSLPQKRQEQLQVRDKPCVFRSRVSLFLDAQEIGRVDRDERLTAAEIDKASTVLVDRHRLAEQRLRRRRAHRNRDFRLDEIEFALEPLAAGFDLDGDRFLM